MFSRGQVVNLYHNVFNLKMALIALCTVTPLVYIKNIGYGHDVALATFVSQAPVNFFLSGFTSRMLQHFSPIKNPLLSYLGAAVSATTLMFLFSYSVHVYRGTIDAFWVALIPTGISFISSFITNKMTRSGYWRPGNYKE